MLHLLATSVALNRSEDETVHAIALLVDVMAGVLIVLGIALPLFGLFRRAS